MEKDPEVEEDLRKDVVAGKDKRGGRMKKRLFKLTSNCKCAGFKAFVVYRCHKPKDYECANCLKEFKVEERGESK